jgi:hypothetical protein
VELGIAKVLHITERAVRVVVEEGPCEGMGSDDDEPLWIPKSQLHSSSELDDTTLIDETGRLVVSAWFANQRGIKP